ncbi:synaptonemal complex central element protein 3 [Salarias fasciatus]|uniref:Synaptonemal complex central element protein 3 n=1 Tax=Salarias fasciatus TaxID=181472 RepID=A0A672F6D4_SALFA|nr:synaptonemal complex central element protein 3 [Salarias fasciatus]
MSDSSPAELPRSPDIDMMELDRDVERITEGVEDMSVQLTWMAYDMVALRTSPELGAAMQALQEAYQRCKAAVCGDLDLESGMDNNPEPASATVAEM